MTIALGPQMISSLVDLVRFLDAQLADNVKAEVRDLGPEDLWKMHLGLNGFIRSVAYYKNESIEGKACFERLGMPDEGSAVLGPIYWRHLSALPVSAEVVAKLIEQHSCFLAGEERHELAKDVANDYARLAA